MMSMDKSLKAKSSLERHRNVLTRAERIEKLKETGRWTEASKATGLPKVAHRKASVGKKEKAPKQAAVAGAEGQAAAPGAAPTAGATPPAAAPTTGKKEMEKDKKDKKEKRG